MASESQDGFTTRFAFNLMFAVPLSLIMSLAAVAGGYEPKPLVALNLCIIAAFVVALNSPGGVFRA